jgi:hypothetical protein
MRKILAVILFFLTTISHARANSFEVAPPPGNWNKVQSLPTNTNITIELKYGEEVSGEFVRLAEDSIVVKEFEREKVFPRHAVARIKWMKPGSRARNAAIIGGIFFGIGFGLGYAGAAYVADQNSMPAGERAAAGAAIGGLIGGAAAAISMAYHPGPRGEVIYKAR